MEKFQLNDDVKTENLTTENEELLTAATAL